MENWFPIFEQLGTRYLRSVAFAAFFYGLLYLIFWKWNRFPSFRVPQLIRTPKALPLKEAILTLLNLAVYMVPVGASLVLEKITGYTARYSQISEFGWPYFFFFIILLILVQDAHFYWAHRWLHLSKIKAHDLHHQFLNPTPWAAYSFHAYEGLVLAIPYTIALFVLPWHPLAVLLFALSAIFLNGFLHLGYDPLPKAWRAHWLLKWINTPTHHCHHHQRFNSNFGLYFTFWDKLMGTERNWEAMATGRPASGKK